nr:uncharacterized protein LOC113717086 [Coffea arabica]
MSTETMKKFHEKKPTKQENSRVNEVIETRKKPFQILSKKQFERESKEQGVIMVLVFKEVKISAIVNSEEVPPEILKLLSDFSDVAPEDLPHGLPPMRDIQHAIDFIPGSQLPNLPACRMNTSESAKLKRRVDAIAQRTYSNQLKSLCSAGFIDSKERRNLENIFQPFIGRFLVVYFDDILIYSKNNEKHINYLQQVMRVLRQEKFYINLKKCIFMAPNVVFLGFVVSNEGIAVDLEKVEAIAGRFLLI